MSYRLKYYLASGRSLFSSFIPESNLYLFGDPRGGTTWLAEMLLSIPKTSILWEPLHLKYASDLYSIGFGWRQYIPENESWGEAEKLIAKIVSGKQWNVFSSQRINPLRHLFAEKLLVKFCRGNRLLPWFVNHYDLEYKPIYLIRHPFAVASSQLQQGGWDSIDMVYRNNSSKFDQFKQSDRKFFNSLHTKEEHLVSQWCISNKYTLEHADCGKKWILVSYENLFVNPEEVLQSVFEEWGIHMPDIDYNKKSYTTQETYTEDKASQLSKWKTTFSDQQIEQMMRVIEYFGIKMYSDDVLPQI